jgi:translation elongation factor EF-1alpha
MGTQNVNLGVLGHSRAGKSTLLGRWMVDAGALDRPEIERLEREGHGTPKYSAVSANEVGFRNPCT